MEFQVNSCVSKLIRVSKLIIVFPTFTIIPFFRQNIPPRVVIFSVFSKVAKDGCGWNQITFDQFMWRVHGEDMLKGHHIESNMKTLLPENLNKIHSIHGIRNVHRSYNEILLKRLNLQRTVELWKFSLILELLYPWLKRALNAIAVAE